MIDVLSSGELPELTALRDHSSEELQAAVDAGSQAGAIMLKPDPVALLSQISGSGVAAPEPRPRLIGPWLWDIGTALQLVYALSFRRP